ncbi:NAD(P)-dependent oxidoreductase [Rhodovastum atsumiense]|uniref:NAD(P)-dependent oxidoreductase n=1 Tax=Rhodovastum atsumiense TaxID=504468 RepID=A0A5M6IPL8_9PROT|nr:NAD(P)-dependent oxidoreductase [Rhodovastum atsumiense]KAA5610223.1 NAD(P)-dependent oxidoreductase [Rhodovastum atsumiense]CAH2604161.1 NAD(P)-dependent oxidoreductase [Rhodovastum atsumiense]
MSRIVAITGAAGNIGRKLSAHCVGLGWTLRRLDRSAMPGVIAADLLQYDDTWAASFAGVDAVIHLAGHGSQFGDWRMAQENIDMTANVLRAARRHGARRVIFASSNWVMVGYRFAGVTITPDLTPHPLTPYGMSKLAGERLGWDVAQQGVGFIAFRIGWNQPVPGNRPGPHMTMGRWGQQMWLSDRDLCQAHERAVLAEGVDFAVLNLMSDNPGMPWDIETTKRVIGYAPQDGWTAELDEAKSAQEEMARRSRALAADLEAQVMLSEW